jgi:hypothetical protein
MGICFPAEVTLLRTFVHPTDDLAAFGVALRPHFVGTAFARLV